MPKWSTILIFMGTDSASPQNEGYVISLGEKNEYSFRRHKCNLSNSPS